MNRLAVEIARRLRKNSTDAEKLLWEELRDRKLDGKKFYRQYPIQFPYEGEMRFVVPDFYCHEYKLVVELDGPIHEYQKEMDKFRTVILNSQGIKVLRFKNDEVMNSINTVLDTIKKEFV